MKTLIKYLLKTIKWITLLIFFYLLIAVVFSLLSTHPKKLNCKQDKEIFITSNGVHLDIIIPTEILDVAFKKELNIKTGAKYISFGWGDKGFYLVTPTWNELKFSTAINAVFLKSETAVHLTNYYNTNNKWKKLTICEAQLDQLIAYIDASFKKNTVGGKMEIKNSGYSKYDTFYEAKGSYSCLFTCNNWVNEALKKAGIKTSIWSPFDLGVLYHIDR